MRKFHLVKFGMLWESQGTTERGPGEWANPYIIKAQGLGGSNPFHSKHIRSVGLSMPTTCSHEELWLSALILALLSFLDNVYSADTGCLI